MTCDRSSGGFEFARRAAASASALMGVKSGMLVNSKSIYHILRVRIMKQAMYNPLVAMQSEVDAESV